MNTQGENYGSVMETHQRNKRKIVQGQTWKNTHKTSNVGEYFSWKCWILERKARELVN